VLSPAALVFVITIHALLPVAIAIAYRQDRINYISIASLIIMRFLISFLVFILLASPASSETGRLPKGVTPSHYDITIRPDAKAMRFTGSERIKITVEVPTKSITLNAADLDVTSAYIGTEAADLIKIDAVKQTVTLSFIEEIPAGDHVLSLEFAGKINTSASGLFAVDYKTDAGDDKRMLATQFEAPDARRFAPMWDEPALKATFRLTSITPDGQTPFSNMPVKTSRKLTSGEMLTTFDISPKMSSYLLFFGMGEVERTTKMAGSVEVGIITRKGVSSQGDYALNAAVNMIEYYNDYFGIDYPLPKLDMIAAPGSSQFFGAMENWGAILYFERRVLIDPKLVTESQRQDVYNTVGHEVAHQWFGNIVTMAWWDDLWLNEGFASWMETKISNDLNPDWQLPVQSVGGGRQSAMALDARKTTHPIIQKIETVDEISQAFDTITYQKGEAVISMLEDMIGPDNFRKGIRAYMKDHAYKNTETKQLWAALEEASGQPVAEVMDGFTKQGGVPMIRVESTKCLGGQTQLMIAQGRFGTDAESKKPLTWKVPVAIGLANNRDKKSERFIISGAKAKPYVIEGCGVPVVNLGQRGYYRTLYSAPHYAVIKDEFAQLSPEDQVGFLSDSIALSNAQYATIGQHLGLMTAVPENANPLVWEKVASQLAQMDNLLEGDKARPAFRRKAAQILSPQMKRVGWEAVSGEGPAVAQLRETLIPVLARFGDAELSKQAKDIVEKSFNDPDSVSGPLRLTALNVFSRSMNDTDWDVMHDRAKSEKSPVAKALYYSSLASVENPRLAQRALDIALTDEAPVPIRAEIIDNVSGEHPALAFDWAVKNKAAVNAVVEESSKNEFIVGLASTSSDTALSNRVIKYSIANLPKSAQSAARKVVSSIGIRADRKRRVAPGIAAWAKGR
jgi:aminopeptidase N